MEAIFGNCEAAAGAKRRAQKSAETSRLVGDVLSNRYFCTVLGPRALKKHAKSISEKLRMKDQERRAAANKRHTRNLFVTADGQNCLLPYALVTVLFFLWGFAHSILDVLNKHFQDSLHVSKTESAFVQVVVYGGYFLMALPAGRIIRRFGYRTGVVTGLLLYGIGALLFIPGGRLGSFPFFLFSLFVIGCGLTCLETSANPYVTVLGNEQGAEQRINLSQAFNGLGWMVGPIVGGLFVFADGSSAASVATPYTIIGVAVLLIAAVFSRIRLPEFPLCDAAYGERNNGEPPLRKRRMFLWGMLALFLYVAAQTGINSFFINYVTESSDMSKSVAAAVLGIGCMGLFLVGRLAGAATMSAVRPERLLLWCSVGAVFAMAVTVACTGWASVAALLLCYLCESIMFPTIFAIALRGIRRYREQASSLLIMCIVGGAIAPVIMGAIADTTGSMAVPFLVPLVCFVFITLYSLLLNAERKVS